MGFSGGLIFHGMQLECPVGNVGIVLGGTESDTISVEDDKFLRVAVTIWTNVVRFWYYD